MFSLHKRGDWRFHLVTLDLFSFLFEVLKTTRRSSVVLFRPLSQAFLDAIFHVLNTIIAHCGDS